MVLDGLPGLYGLKYDSVTACGLPLYLCSYKLDGSATAVMPLGDGTHSKGGPDFANLTFTQKSKCGGGW